MCIKICLSMHPRNFGCMISSFHAYVVVIFLSRVTFVSVSFLGIVICMLMKLKQKKKKNYLR